jgi:hypothetical protein
VSRLLSMPLQQAVAVEFGDLCVTTSQIPRRTITLYTHPEKTPHIPRISITLANRLRD